MPDPAAAQNYGDGYKIYRRLYPALRSVRLGL